MDIFRGNFLDDRYFNGVLFHRISRWYLDSRNISCPGSTGVEYAEGNEYADSYFLHNHTVHL